MKIVKPYPIMLDNWQVALPAEAQILAFSQVGSVGYMFVLEDALGTYDPQTTRRMVERRFLTIPAGRATEIGDEYKFIGFLKMNDPTAQVPLAIVLFVFEKVAPLIHRVQ